MPSLVAILSKSSWQNLFAQRAMVILEAPYFDGCKTNPQDFVNWMNGMEQFFEQVNFADNKKVRYAKLKLRGGAQMFWEDLEYFRYLKYELVISVWEV